MTPLDNPVAVEERLIEIDNMLAEKQNHVEDVAMTWFRVKKKRELQWTEAFIKAEGTVAERNAEANREVSGLTYATPSGPVDAWEAEGRWEAHKASVRVLETRSAIGMSLLKSQRGVGA